MVVMPVADDQIFDLRRVEPHLLQSTHQHVATLVGVVKRVEDDDAVARWNGPRADVAETEVVQILEHANRLEQPIRFGRKARRLSRQRWALRSGRCAERLCVGDEIVSRNLHRSRDVLLRLLGRRRTAAPSEIGRPARRVRDRRRPAGLAPAPGPPRTSTTMSPISTFFDMTALSRSVLPRWLIIYDNRRPSWSAWLLIGASAERSDE